MTPHFPDRVTNSPGGGKVQFILRLNMRKWAGEVFHGIAPPVHKPLLKGYYFFFFFTAGQLVH